MLVRLLAVASVIAIAPAAGNAQSPASTESASDIISDGALARPMLAYDMTALAGIGGDDEAPVPRLDHAGYDRSHDLDELRTAHHLAADMVRAFDVEPVVDAVLLGR